MAVDTRQLGLVESERLIELAAGSGGSPDETNPLALAYKPGDLIAGKYRLVRLIGRGGMGVVWEAHSDALDIRVAVKLIHQFTGCSDDQQRLLLEAKAAARLVDPGVVRVFDCGETLNGDPYIVMELLEGEDLATRLDERGRLKAIEAVRTLLPILRALGTAHAANVVHRDVKPENVFFTKSGTGEEQPKLLDFGIAKMDMPWEKRLTQAGSALGSPNYMSPEQARGEEVDGRCDVWGFCVVMYEAIAGELPFDGNSYNAVMHAILSARVTPFPELGIEEPELWAILARGFERETALRWQTCAALADVLVNWLIERGVQHDVSGVSLLATRTNYRASHVRTLESVRPAKIERERSPLYDSSLAQTGPRSSESQLAFWGRRPRWFVPLVSALALLGLLLTVWRILPRPFAESSKTTLDTKSARAAEQAQPIRAEAPLPVGQVVPALPEAAPTAAPTAGTGRVSRVSAAKSSAKKQSESAKGEPFKSPFD